MDIQVIVQSFQNLAVLVARERHSCRVALQPIGGWVNENHLVRPSARPPMIRLTRLPEEVTRLLAPLKSSFSYRHHLVFCWLLVAHLVCFEKATLQGLARYIPGSVAAWHLRRLLAAGRWQWAHVLEW